MHFDHSLLYLSQLKLLIMYPAELVKPMREDLTSVGFVELTNPDEVNSQVPNSETAVLIVNSVCGCAAANARPGAKIATQEGKSPDHLVTVFAGVDVDSTKKAREMMIPFPPSSPSIALFKDGQLVHMLERHHIEGRSADMIAANLAGAYDEFC